jgi:hypothetical protein
MPLYTAIIQHGSESDATKARIADEITRIHTVVMKVPRGFGRVGGPDIRPVRRRRPPR